MLWLLLHSSRFQHPQTGSCVLDDWKQQAEASGERVLGALRGGVQAPWNHWAGASSITYNGELREALQSGQLSHQQFHEHCCAGLQFLFLFTTEIATCSSRARSTRLTHAGGFIRRLQRQSAAGASD